MRATHPPRLAQVLQAADISFADLVKEVAVQLYDEKQIGLGLGAQITKMNRFDFQGLLAERGVDHNYDVEEYEKDKAAIDERLGNSTSE